MKDLYLIQITTIFKKEFARWSRIWIQTILPSVITMFLYITIFGNFIGERIGEIQWFSLYTLHNTRPDNYADYFKLLYECSWIFL